MLLKRVAAKSTVMKLISTKEYLLLIDEEAEIKPKNKVWWEDPEGITSQLNTALEITEDMVFMSELSASEIEALPHEVSKVIAYHPLTKEAKELDLPLLPNPFRLNKIEQAIDDIDTCLEEAPVDFVGTGSNWRASEREEKEWTAKWKTAIKVLQSDKLFSLEDMKRALKLKNGFDDEGHTIFMTDDEIIQSLSTKQLPKEFVPEYEYTYDGDTEHDEGGTLPGAVYGERELKTITNSEGKQQLVGKYIY